MRISGAENVPSVICLTSRPWPLKRSTPGTHAEEDHENVAVREGLARDSWTKAAVKGKCEDQRMLTGSGIVRALWGSEAKPTMYMGRIINPFTLSFCRNF